MARYKIRRIPVYLDSKKIAEVENNTYEITSNDEAQVGSEGYMAHSDGAIMTSIETNVIQPVAGMSVDFIEPLIQKRDVTMAVPLNGKLHSIVMREVSGSTDSDSRSGKASSRYRFEGGKPDVVG